MNALSITTLVSALIFIFIVILLIGHFVDKPEIKIRWNKVKDSKLGQFLKKIFPFLLSTIGSLILINMLCAHYWEWWHTLEKQGSLWLVNIGIAFSVGIFVFTQNKIARYFGCLIAIIIIIGSLSQINRLEKQGTEIKKIAQPPPQINSSFESQATIYTVNAGEWSPRLDPEKIQASRVEGRKMKVYNRTGVPYVIPYLKETRIPADALAVEVSSDETMTVVGIPIPTK